MNNNSGALSFEALLETGQLDRATRHVNNQLRDIGNVSERESKRMDAAFRKASIAVGSYFTFQAAKQFVSDIVRVRNEFQQLEIAFTTMLKSKQQADQLVAEIADIAATTPFGMKDVANGTKMLLAYGSEVANVREEITRLGDIAAGVGAPINDLIYLYGTLRTQGRAYAQDIRQFAGRGIPIYEELAKVLQINTSEVAKFVEEGKVGFKEVEQALKNMTAAGTGQFAGLMEAQSKSIGGALERMGDAWDMMLNKIGKDSEGAINQSIAAVSALIENYETVGRVLTGLIATYGTYKAAIMTVRAMEKAATVSKLADAGNAEAAARIANAQAAHKEAVATFEVISAKQAEAAASLAAQRAKLSELAATEAVAISEAKAATASVAAAEAKVASLTAYSSSTKVAAAQNELLAASEAKAAATKSAEAATRAVNHQAIAVETAAKKANTLATEVNAAANRASIASLNASTVANTRLTAAQQLRVAATRLATRAQALLNATMLTNPYVLLAVAVGGLVTTIWALTKATDGQTAAQRRLNAMLDETKKRYDELKSEADDLLRIIQDSTQTDYRRAKAYERLSQILPGVTDRLSLHDIKTQEATKSSKALNEELDRFTMGRLKSELDQATQRLDEFRKAYPQLTEAIEKGADPHDVNNMKKVIEDQVYLVRRLAGEYGEMVKQQEQSLEMERLMALPRQEQIKHFEQVLKELYAQKEALETNLLLANQTGTAFGMWQQYLSGNLRQLEIVQGKIANTEAAIKGYDVKPTKPTGDKPKGPKIFPSGSLAEINRQIAAAEEALSKIPTNQTARIAKMQETILNLTKQRVEAEKIVEVRTWEESLEYKRKLYEEYERAIAPTKGDSFTGADLITAERAKAYYADLRKEGESYYQFIKNKIAEIEAIENKSREDYGRLLTLTNIKRELDGVSSPIEQYAEKIETLRTSSKSVTEYIAGLQTELDKLNAVSEHEKDGAWAQNIKTTNDELKASFKDLSAELDQFLNSYYNAQRERQSIDKHFQDLRTALENRYKGSLDSEEYKKQLAELNKAQEEAYKVAAENAVLLSKKYQDTQKTILETGRAELVKQVEMAQQAFDLVQHLGPDSEVYRRAFRELNDAKRALGDFDTSKWSTWVNLLSESLAKLREMGGPLGEIAGFISGMTKHMDNFQIAVSRNYTEMERQAAAQDMAVKAGADLINTIIASAAQRKEKEEEYYRSVITYQNEYNRLLSESLLLQAQDTGSIFLDNTIESIKKGVDALGEISVQYQEALLRLIDEGEVKTGTKRKVDWAKVGGGALAGAGYGATLGSGVLSIPGAVIGGIVGGLAGLLGGMKKVDVYGKLLDEYPQLIDGQGRLNEEMAKALITSGKLSAETQAMAEDVLKYQEMLDEAIQVVKDGIKDLTGEIGDNLASALIEAFKAGEDAAKAFGDVVKDTLERMIFNVAYQAAFGEIFKELEKRMLASYGMDNKANRFQDPDNDILDDLLWFNEVGGEKAKQFEKDLKKTIDQINEMTGLDLFGGDQDRAKGLTGQIQGITEETASLIAGQMNAIRINQADTQEIIRQQLFHLAKISANSEYNQHLASIDRSLQRMQSAQYWRDMGVSL